MNSTTTLTSVGQLTLPKFWREKYNLKSGEKLTIKPGAKENQIILEKKFSYKDVAGIFNKYAKKGIPFKKLRELEKKAVEKAMVEDYKKSINE